MSGAVARPGCVWIQGAGELASGVAVRLWRAGYRLVLAEEERPRAVRRLVAFAEAVYAGRTVVEEVVGLRRPAARGDFADEAVVVIVDPGGAQLPRLRPAAVVDARMTKRAPAGLPVGPWPVIGLGPGFCCGCDAVLVIETQRGARLGAVLATGEAAPNTGVPGPLGGETERRLLRAPAAGRLVARRRLGELVTAGECVGEIAGAPVISNLDGLLRGLVHESVDLVAGEKVGDVDPRGASVDPALVSDKALAVAGGVLEALLRLKVLPAAGV